MSDGQPVPEENLGVTARSTGEAFRDIDQSLSETSGTIDDIASVETTTPMGQVYTGYSGYFHDFDFTIDRTPRSVASRDTYRLASSASAAK